MRKVVLTATSALASMILSGSLLAQTAAAPAISEITVQATRVMTTTVGQTTTGEPGVPIQNVSLKYGVSTEGLDLSSQHDKQELQNRVSRAAMAACKELSRQFPDATTTDLDCAKAATKHAMAQVQQLEAAAAVKK